MYRSELEVITKHLSYYDRQAIAKAVQEASISTSAIFANVSNYYLQKYIDYDILGKYKVFASSKGELNKIKHFEDTENCLKLLRNDGNPQVSQGAVTVSELLMHLKSRQNSFKRGFSLEKTSLEIIYTTLTATVVKATSILIGQSEYGYGYNQKMFNIFDNMILKGITYTNGLFKNGKVDDFARTVLSMRAPITEGLFTPFTSLFTLIGTSILNIIRNFVYWIYDSSRETGDYFEQQALYLQLHEVEIKNNPNLTEAQKKEIIAKQRKWSERLLALADTFQIEDVKAAKEAAKKAKEADDDLTKDKILNGGQPSNNDGDINY